jgi:outer membrane biosynthesis protein TonB
MGLIANVVIENTGVCLPAAYIAVSRNPVQLAPVGNNVFNVVTTFNTWNTHADRLNGRSPVQNSMLQFQCSDLAVLYTTAYDQLKLLFPDSHDEQESPEPEPEPTAPEPEPTAPEPEPTAPEPEPTAPEPEPTAPEPEPEPTAPEPEPTAPEPEPEPEPEPTAPEPEPEPEPEPTAPAP